MSNDPAKPNDLDNPADPPAGDSGERVTESQLSDAEVVERLQRLWPNRSDTTVLGEIVGRRVGKYVIRRVLGSGSFGIVYLAHDEQLDRDCALKIPRAEVLVDEDKRRRFNTEAAAAATLAHPGIVPVYEAEIDGQMPYIASAICPGPNLADWLERRVAPIPEREAAWFVAQLADAMHYAHQRGVFHRDLKPSNVLMQPNSADTVRDGELEDAVVADGELADYTPRLIDFGLAKLAGSDAAATRSSMLLGTPVYMAPEQLGTTHEAADPRLIDVYGLGCLLYELLTGAAPFARDSVAETLLAVREHDPVLRHRRQSVSTNLEAVCHKAIEKRPEERYASARALAGDLERLLDNKEVTARPITSWERGIRWCRRNPLPAASLAVAFVAILAVAVVTLRHNAKLADALITSNNLREVALHANTAVNEARRTLQKELYAHEMKLAFDAKNKQWNEEVDRILDLFDSPSEEDVRTFSWYMLKSLTAHSAPIVMSGHEGPVREVALHPDGQRIVSVGDDGTIRVWKIATGQLLATIVASDRTLNALAVSPDGEYVVTGSQGLALWRLSTAERIRPLTWHSTTIEEAAFSPDGRFVASGARNRPIHLMCLNTGGIKRFQTDNGNETLLFTEDGRGVTSVCRLETENVIRTWDTASGDLTVGHIGRRYMRFDMFAFTQDEQRVAFANKKTGQLWLCDVETWETVGMTEKVRTAHEDVRFSPDDRLIAAAGQDGILRYWRLTSGWTKSDRDVIAGKQVAIPAHEGRITSIAFVGLRRIATAGEDGLIKIWQLGDDSRHIRAADDDLRWLSLLPGRRAMITINDSAQLVILDEDAGVTLLREGVPERVRLEAPLPQSDLLVVAGPESQIEVWDISVPELKAAYELEHDVKAAAISANDRWLAATGVDGYTAVWDLQTNERLYSHKLATWGICIGFSPQSDLLAVGGRVRDTLLIDTASWQVVRRLPGISHTRSLTFSPDGRTLATSHGDAAIRLWDVESGELIAQFKGHRGTIGCLAFHPSGDTLLSGCSRDSIRCWDINTHRDLGVVWWLSGQQAVDELRFDESGRTLTVVIRESASRQHELLTIETEYPVSQQTTTE